MNARGAQWDGGSFILQYTSLKMAVLLHKTALSSKLWSYTVFDLYGELLFFFLSQSHKSGSVDVWINGVYLRAMNCSPLTIFKGKKNRLCLALA